MFSLKILASPLLRRFSDLHPFYKWNKQLSDSGINVELVFDHKKIKLDKTDCLIVNHMYFHHMWNNKTLDASANEEEWIKYLIDAKKKVGKLIWWCAQDTTCSSGFGVIPYVDVFLKNQVLKDTDYYIGEKNQEKNLRIWLDQTIDQKRFKVCSKEHVHKIKVGWNLGFNDYRYFPIKLHYLLSNYVPYKLLPLNYTGVEEPRTIDLTFRGKMNYDNQFPQKNAISFQRNKVFTMLSELPYKIACGAIVAKKQYWNELRNSKICISPFGYGEVCYRDFESFIAGALLLKPSMEHLITFGDLFIPNETYIPLKWDLDDLQETMDKVLTNFHEYKDIAKNGQESFKKVINEAGAFVNAVNRIVK